MSMGSSQSVFSGGSTDGYLASDADQSMTQKLKSEQFFIVVTMMVAWVALLFVFSLPDREEPLSVGGLDLLGLGKVISRLGGLAFLVAVNLMMVRQLKIRLVAFYLAGFIAYFGWSVVTIAWSALPAVSAGQLMTLALVMLLCVTIARAVESDSGVKTTMFLLSLLFIVRALAMVLLYVIVGSHTVSREHGSFFHSTDAAETASVGIVVLTTAMMGFPTWFTRFVYYPGMIIFGALFVIAQNRLTLIITPPVFLLIFLMNGNRKGLVKLAFVLSLVATLVMLADPGLEMFSKLVGSTEKYAMRSGNDDTLSTLSGRTELWEVVWQEYLTSPIVGLGYFVTSNTGEIDVWSEVKNYSAHNQILQVLATTGIVGLALFLWGLAMPFQLVMSNLLSEGSKGRTARSIAVVFLWLALWGLLNSSFNGPLAATTITFWILVGVAIGYLRKPVENVS